MDTTELGEASSTLAAEDVAAGETLLVGFDADGERHAFLLLGNGKGARVAHRVQRRKDRGSPFSSLQERAGQPLTALEIFLALAPEGMTPPEELVERHEAQALAWGRGAEILTFTEER